MPKRGVDYETCMVRTPHFVVMRSVRDKWGGRAIALLEVEEGYIPYRIDKRLKKVKRIIRYEHSNILTRAGFKKLARLFSEFHDTIRRFEQLYPCHFLLKEFHKAKDKGQLIECHPKVFNEIQD